ncbi:MAG: hypothetical protein JNL51_08560 [Chitinophagaceae bacterium]|nr:hypothetical protein [Chitinophagaceae bacterium]
MKRSLYDIISVAAIFSYFIPILVVLLRKLWRDTFFILFAVYWLLGGLINMPDLLPGFSEDLKSDMGVIYNLLDIPLILIIFYYTSSSFMIRRYVSFSLALLIVFEAINFLIYGLNYDALKYSLGPGIVIVLIVLSWEIVRYLQKIEHSNRQSAKVFIYAALLFEYGTFTLIYIFDYFIPNSNSEDSFLIYYISTVIAIFIALGGYLIIKIKKRVEEPMLQMQNLMDL